MRRAHQLVLAALAVGTLALTGCADTSGGSQAGGGGDDAAGTSTDPDEQTSNDGGASFPPLTTPPPASAPPVPTDVTITVDDGAGTVAEFTLTCAPEGGDHPTPAEACSALAAGTAAFAPPDPNQACTEIYGGPQTATVRGTLNGAQIQGQFSRANGCEIARWDALTAVFGPVGAAG